MQPRRRRREEPAWLGRSSWGRGWSRGLLIRLWPTRFLSRNFLPATVDMPLMTTAPGLDTTTLWLAALYFAGGEPNAGYALVCVGLPSRTQPSQHSSAAIWNASWTSGERRLS